MLWAQSTTKDTLGLKTTTKTSIYLQFIHSTSHYTTSFFLSFFFLNHSSNSIHNFGKQNQKSNNTFYGAYLYSTSTQHGNLHPAGWPIWFCKPTQESVLATGKTRERLLENASEWTGRVEISKKEVPLYWPTPGFKRRTFKLCVLNRWDFNFCVRSSRLRMKEKETFSGTRKSRSW